MEEKKIRTAIVGATGYAGAELVRLLLTHPSTEIVGLSSVSFAGEEIAAVYPNFKNFPLPILTDADTAIADADVVFASLPHGLSEPLAEQCLASGKLLRFGVNVWRHSYFFQIFHTDLGGIFLASFFHLVDTSHAVVKNRHIVKQVELLEHHSHLGTETVDRLCILRQWIAMI